MIRVHVICEGPTEEDFVRQVLLPPFIGWGIQLLPSCIGRVGHKGGRVKIPRLEFDLQTRFRDRECYCTTLFDFYGLPTDFPGKSAAASIFDLAAKQRAVIVGLTEWAESRFGENAWRFLPYVQMYEFEALLFSRPDILASAIGAPRLAQPFQSIRSQFPTPEWINDDPNTAPSKRIESLHPGYSKPADPVLAATEIGLETIRSECPLFSAWLPENDEAAGCREIFELLDKIYRTVIVKIEVASHSDAYTLFESLNNRGEKLSGVDLIKNKMLASLEKVDAGRIDFHFQQWNKLLTFLGEDDAVQERFFRHFYNAFRENLKGIASVPLATKSNLIRIYEKLINHDAKDCLSQLSTAAKQYGSLLSDGKTDPSKRLEHAIHNLARVQGAPGHLLVLNLLVRKTELELDANCLTKIVWLLVKFFARRNVTDLPPTRDLTRLFMTILDEMTAQQSKGEQVEVLIREQLRAVSASDEQFRQKLTGPVYEENVNATRFVLCSLAEQGMTKETWVDLWKMDGKHFVWTIEHIFPQGEKIPKDWVQMMAGGDKDLAAEYQQSHVHTLGNLTLSGFNSSLGNKSFEDKRDRTDRKGRPVGYKNSLNLNRELAKAKRWSIEQIEARTDDLASETMKLFSLE